MDVRVWQENLKENIHRFENYFPSSLNTGGFTFLLVVCRRRRISINYDNLLPRTTLMLVLGGLVAKKCQYVKPISNPLPYFLQQKQHDCCGVGVVLA
jgi:hypothetical protein